MPFHHGDAAKETCVFPNTECICAVLCCVLLSHATKGMKPEAHKHDVHHACRLFWLVRFTLIYLYCYSDPRPLNCAEDSRREAINWFAIVPSQMETQNRPTGCSHDAFTRTEGPRCVWRQFKALVSQCYLLIVVICVHWGCTFTSTTWIHLLCHCVDLEFCLNVCVSRSYSACWTLLRLIL